ncbi:sel1 repeat family protein [Alteromonas aestuariivivens]|uniref:Sel1 repeat family protein n=1 Tax=Alteromonas aestuariivivens TaxID=1938339 RepID=A0A3D8M889_9ALTE|nr:sel1 repeat family protein [Alteromonas aestuariivivens]RDV26101.1 sel1 repeat family protein [Alteromonas aestuariivivens]
MRGLVLALLAMLLLAGDLARDTAQLVRNATSAKFPQSLLWQASQQGSELAQSRLVELAVAQGQQYWLERLVSLGNADAAWQLYQLVGDDETTERLMRLAAKGNVPEAQLEFALSTDDPAKRETWLLRSARQGYLPAQAALADWYILHQKPDLARPWLEKTATVYTQSTFQLGRMLWEQGDTKSGRQYIEQAAQQGHELATRFSRMFDRYPIQRLSALSAVKWPSAAQCQQRLQFFATSLSAIERAHSLYQELINDPRLANLPLCAQAPVWLKSDALNCSASWLGSGRLGCDVRPLAAAVSQREFTHAIVVLDQGKANIENGVMYLDITDTYSVLVHELAHFSGFVDEYPLSQRLAARYCERRDAPNLVFEGPAGLEPQETAQNWQELQPGVEIHPAKSCDNAAIQAYKPSSGITFLEHHDSGEIPPVYLKLWRQRLVEPSTHTPIYMNLFQAFHKQSQTAEAGVWLDIFEKYRAGGLEALADGQGSSVQ